ncbi:OmpA family protein [Aegicerativicinus sediminis]|uniref:OmpA family protein n=1 Tax=Aegicerativicinus sediminis TaxID=2893202 RepID=UPI001E369567|nr:OmpA family protein [Aegicerativicinus sediminis]
MRTKLFILLFALGSTAMIAQTKLADKFFKNYGYIKASELYEEAVKKGDSSLHVLTRLGDCYYNNSESQQAVKWYGAAANKHKDIGPEYMFKYIQSLKSIGQYAEADEWTRKYMEMQSDDDRLEDYQASNLDKYEDLKEPDNMIVKLLNLPFNTANSDFGAYHLNDKLIFASAKPDNSEKLYGWNKEPFLDLYQTSVSEEDGELKFGEIDFINATKINTKYHEATVTVSNDGKTMYFTRDNMTGKNRLGYDRKGTSHLKIYSATLKDTMWTDIKDLPFNSEKFSNGHPALSPDNKTLYFVSDREGGIGGTDIYSVAINEDGTYGEPMNLGDKVNTEGREMFPFIDKDSTLYFSSDGHLNLGLLDIFKSNILKGEDGEPENMGAPYNSGYDDFAYIITGEGRGYLSSNRPGGRGNDDIYSFTAYECQQLVKGVTRDKRTNEILPGVTVKLIDETGKIVAETTSNQNGEYELEVDCNKKYTILGSKEDYKDDMKELTTDDDSEKVHEIDLYLEPLIIEDQIVINPIFFDFDKWNIRTDAEYELENIVDVMRAHPTMKIKIESHTDSRGSDRYNMKLSDRRAKSTMDYILSRGIEQDRIISAIGYGETQLLNGCSNGVKCSKEEHQLNRRSYFIIVEK